MQTSGLTHTPITKLLLLYTLTSSIALSILDIKHLFPIYVSPHLFPYGQYWRCLLTQVAGFTNSTEALFAAVLVYHCRVVERAWGGRKLATFLLSTLPYTTLLPPLLLTLFLRPITLHKMNYLPSGPTATIFALLAQYHASIPSTYRYTISTSTPTQEITRNPTTGSDDDTGASGKKSLSLTLSDKSTTYLVAAQLALSQFPAMLLPALVGWVVGVAWRTEILPGSGRWRVPGWVVGEAGGSGSFSGLGSGSNSTSGNGRRGSGRFEEFRRRLESEAIAVGGSSSGVGAGGSGSGGGRQRVVN